MIDEGDIGIGLSSKAADYPRSLPNLTSIVHPFTATTSSIDPPQPHHGVSKMPTTSPKMPQTLHPSPTSFPHPALPLPSRRRNVRPRMADRNIPLQQGPHQDPP